MVPDTMVPGSFMHDFAVYDSIIDSTKSFFDKAVPDASQTFKTGVLYAFDQKVKSAAKQDMDTVSKTAPQDPQINKLRMTENALFDRHLEITKEVLMNSKGKSENEIAAEMQKRIEADPKCAVLQKELDAQRAILRGQSGAQAANIQHTGAGTPAQNAAPQNAPILAQDPPEFRAKMHHFEVWNMEVEAVKCMDRAVAANGSDFNSENMQKAYAEYLKISKSMHTSDFMAYLRAHHPELLDDPDQQKARANIDRVFAYKEYDKKRLEIEELKKEYIKELKADAPLAAVDGKVAEDVKNLRIKAAADAGKDADMWAEMTSDAHKLVTSIYLDAGITQKDINKADLDWQAEYNALKPNQRGNMTYEDFVWQKSQSAVYKNMKNDDKERLLRDILVSKMMLTFSMYKRLDSELQMESLKQTGSIFAAPSEWREGAPYRNIKPIEMNPAGSILYKE